MNAATFEAMTAAERLAELDRLAGALWGPTYADPLAAEIGAARRTAFDWKAGKTPVPTVVLLYLARISDESNFARTRLLIALGNFAAAQATAAEALREALEARV